MTGSGLLNCHTGSYSEESRDESLTTSWNMTYRPEIDGLRALAVLPVILFHAGFETFAGGFVGVDVFFVLSGYLITGIILAEKARGTFSLAHFYERRAWRILPALFLVMLACMPLAWLWLLPADMESFCRSLVAVTAFASNILFWREIGYFDTGADLKPLLHTWSLAVEEQYYLVFPLFLALLWTIGKRWIFGSLAVLGLASLGLAQLGAYHKPAATFFLLPTRAWELMIGACIACHQLNHQPSSALVARGSFVAEAGGLVGVLTIAYAILVFDNSTPFPSAYTLVPTVGTALIILFATRETIVGRLLSTKVLVGIGLISYSAYLWHQPLFAFARHRSLADHDAIVMLVLSFAAIALAYISWRYVERPFRRADQVGRFKVLMSAFAVGIGIVLAGALGLVTHGYAQRPQLEALVYPIPEMGWNVPVRLARIQTQTGHLEPGDASIAYEVSRERNADATRVLDGIRHHGLYRVRPEKILCDSFVKDRCAAHLNGMPFYFDDDHLSEFGADQIVRRIIPELKGIPAASVHEPARW